MGRRIDPMTERKVRFLFSLGMSCRDIAAHTRARRSAVSKIVRRPFLVHRRPSNPPPLTPRRVTPYKCQCGFIVELSPCVICAARAKAEAST